MQGSSSQAPSRPAPPRNTTAHDAVCPHTFFSGQAVLRYFKQLGQEGVSAIVHLKAVTIGQEAVGKTSLVQVCLPGS